MEVLFIVLVIAALIGGIVWNHRNAARAMEGVEFSLAESPGTVRAAISLAYCGGMKATIRATLSRVTVAAAGGSFRFTTKIGDAGTIEINADGHGGSIVRAHADELYVGSHPKSHFSRGFLAVGAAITHAICKVLGVTPNAAAIKRFETGFETRLRRELLRQSNADSRPAKSTEHE